MDKYHIINEFIVKDGITVKGNIIRKSVLLSAIKDLGFNQGLISHKIQFKAEQKEEIENNLPIISNVIIFFTIVDLIARVMKARTPNKYGENRIFFVWCLKKYFGVSQKACEKLWDLRNAVTHQYKVCEKVKLELGGGYGLIKYNKSKKSWHCNIRAMYTSAWKAKREVEEELLSKTNINRYNNFIINHGFYYITH